MNRRFILAFGGAALLAPPSLAATRPTNWAIPMALDGVPNLHRVTRHLYRSAQPTAAGLGNLAGRGIKTVINLRQLVDDVPLAAGTDLTLRRVRMKSRDVGEGDGAKMVQTLRYLREGITRGPTLVHCHHGADRTGAVIAVYRMLYQAWTRGAALDELENGGFGFHSVWANIPQFVESCDLAALKRRVEA